MNKIFRITVIFIIFLLVLLLISAIFNRDLLFEYLFSGSERILNAPSPYDDTQFLNGTVEIYSEKEKENKIAEFDVEIAETDYTITTGFMGRKEILNDHGMLFLFDEDQDSAFWMKNCLFPLDMLFFNDGELIYIEHSAPICKSDPCPVYRPKNGLFDTVIEINGGISEKIGIEEGDYFTYIVE